MKKEGLNLVYVYGLRSFTLRHYGFAMVELTQNKNLRLTALKDASRIIVRSMEYTLVTKEVTDSFGKSDI